MASDDERWPVVESIAEYETGWYTGGYDLVEQPDGTRKRYYWADLPPAVVVVAVHDGDVLFVDQYRPTVRRHCLELPAGIVEPAGDGPDAHAEDGAGHPPDEGFESYERAGARELREETGYAADDVTFVEECWCSTGVLRHERGVVVASGLSPGDPELDENEFISVERVPVEDALDVAREPPTTDATIEGLLLAAADGHLEP